jgi:class 3 adenylate cyclase
MFAQGHAMNHRLKGFLQIKNSFLLVLMLILVLIVGLAALLTRLTLRNIDASEAEKRESVTTFVTSSFEHGTIAVDSAVRVLEANDQYMKLFAAKDHDGLFAATKPLFDTLKQNNGVKQMQFTQPDFKVLLRAHNPALYNDDVTTSRPTLVECLTQHHPVAGLEQGRSGYGFRAAVPATFAGSFIGCAEMGSDLDASFLEPLNANYPGRWAIVNLDRGTSLTTDAALVAFLNEPAGSSIRNPNYSTPDDILKSMRSSQTYFEYLKSSEEMALYVPIRNFKGDVALYVRYVTPTTYYATVRRMILNALVISILGMALTGLAFSMLYRGIKIPVLALVAETEKIKNFDLKDKVEIKASLVELEKLIKAIADMKMGLQSFQKYVPANLVRQLIETHQEARIGGKLKELTVFFSDIADFTTITEDLPPNELTLQLSEYFNEVTNIIMEHRGTVDKYIGDAVMAFWGAPIDMEDHALCACRAALACKKRIGDLSARWRSEGKYAFHTRIGLSTGEIIVGNIGSDQRLNYSVIGDSVNLASRLEGLNKDYRTTIIISEATYQKCAQHIEARLLDFVAVKGKLEPVRIYELIGQRGDISPRQKESLSIFARAIEAYMGRNWDAALTLLRGLKQRDPSDTIADLYIERCEHFKVDPPDASWTGYHRYTTK